MSALATLLGTYAAGHVLTHGGKDYEFRRIDKATRVLLEVRYFKRAREAVYALKDDLDEAQYDRQLSRVTDAYRRGEYAFRPGGECYGYHMTTVSGLAELVRHLTGCGEDDADSLCQSRTVEVMHVVLCVVMESFDDFKKKAIQMADSPEMLAIVALLSGCQPKTSNGSPSGSATAAPASPNGASASRSTPGSPTPRSDSSTATPATPTAN